MLDNTILYSTLEQMRESFCAPHTVLNVLILGTKNYLAQSKYIAGFFEISLCCISNFTVRLDLTARQLMRSADEIASSSILPVQRDASLGSCVEDKLDPQADAATCNTLP